MGTFIIRSVPISTGVQEEAALNGECYQSRGYVKFQNISPVQTTAVLMGKERKSLKAVRLKFECADTFPGDLVKNAHSG